MSDERFSRTAALLGQENMNRLKAAHVAVFGLGGVGGYAAEALVRSGVGELTLIDSDRIVPSNLNRQILALESTVGTYKADAAADRIRDISPETKVHPVKMFYLPDTAEELDMSRFSYIVDAVDTVTAKLEIIRRAGESGVPVISCMGTGNKLDPSALRAADIFETSVCPLARIMRSECRKRGIERLRVVYSVEPPMERAPTENYAAGRRDVPASAVFVPAAAGMLLASEAVRYIIGQER